MPNSDDSELAFQRLSVKAWIGKLNDALDRALTKRTSKRLKKLNRQHNSIRDWDLGNGGSAKSTGSAGWRLIR